MARYLKHQNNKAIEGEGIRYTYKKKHIKKNGEISYYTMSMVKNSKASKLMTGNRQFKVNKLNKIKNLIKDNIDQFQYDDINALYETLKDNPTHIMSLIRVS